MESPILFFEDWISKTRLRLSISARKKRLEVSTITAEINVTESENKI